MRDMGTISLVMLHMQLIYKSFNIEISLPCKSGVFYIHCDLFVGSLVVFIVSTHFTSKLITLFKVSIIISYARRSNLRNQCKME